MGLFTRDISADYAQRKMPAPATGPGPWGAAIRYWLPRKKMRQADLVRATRLGKNTVSSATLGLDVNTATLVAIAKAFNEPLEVILVSPEWMDRQDAQRRMIQEAVERALRGHDAPSSDAMRQAIDQFDAAAMKGEDDERKRTVTKTRVDPKSRFHAKKRKP